MLSAADSRVSSLCAEFDIEIISGKAYPEPRQTRAPVTIRRIIDRRGIEHARLVLSTIVETEGNGGLLEESTLWAVSDLITACPDWVNERTSEWLEAWDGLPLGRNLFLVQELAGVTHQRHALAGLCYIYLRAVLDPDDSLTDREPKTQGARGIVPPVPPKHGMSAELKRQIYEADSAEMPRT